MTHTHLFIISISISSDHDPAHIRDLHFRDLVLSLSLSNWDLLLLQLLLLLILLLRFMFRSFSRSLWLVLSWKAEACNLCVVFLLMEVRCSLIIKLCFRARSLQEKRFKKMPSVNPLYLLILFRVLRALYVEVHLYKFTPLHTCGENISGKCQP